MYILGMDGVGTHHTLRRGDLPPATLLDSVASLSLRIRYFAEASAASPVQRVSGLWQHWAFSYQSQSSAALLSLSTRRMQWTTHPVQYEPARDQEEA